MLGRRSPYRKFDHSDLTLRDLLAIDRTLVANERTLLGFVRTTLALLAAGAAVLHFFEEPATEVAGWTLIALAVPVAGIGIWHYLRRRLALIPLVRRGLPHTDKSVPAEGEPVLELETSRAALEEARRLSR
jgi:putative membrane protein